MLFGIRMIPYGTRYIGEASTAIKKIQELLLFPKYETNIPAPNAANMAITMKNSTFSWDICPQTSNNKSSKSNGTSSNVSKIVMVEEVPLNQITTDINEEIDEEKSNYCLKNMNLSIEKVIFKHIKFF